MTAPHVVAPANAQAASDALVVLGFSGDLVNKKIIPALCAMAKKTPSVPVIDIAGDRDDSLSGASDRRRAECWRRWPARPESWTSAVPAVTGMTI